MEEKALEKRKERSSFLNVGSIIVARGEAEQEAWTLVETIAAMKLTACKKKAIVRSSGCGETSIDICACPIFV